MHRPYRRPPMVLCPYGNRLDLQRSTQWFDHLCRSHHHKPMFSMHPTTTPLPQNAAVHVRLRFRRLLGIPVLAPAVVVDTFHRSH